jgi:hypothetical protein
MARVLISLVSVHAALLSGLLFTAARRIWVSPTGRRMCWHPGFQTQDMDPRVWVCSAGREERIPFHLEEGVPRDGGKEEKGESAREVVPYPIFNCDYNHLPKPFPTHTQGLPSPFLPTLTLTFSQIWAQPPALQEVRAEMQVQTAALAQPGPLQAGRDPDHINSVRIEVTMAGVYFSTKTSQQMNNVNEPAEGA